MVYRMLILYLHSFICNITQLIIDVINKCYAYNTNCTWASKGQIKAAEPALRKRGRLTEVGMWDGEQHEPFKGKITHKVLMAISRATLVLRQFILLKIQIMYKQSLFAGVFFIYIKAAYNTVRMYMLVSKTMHKLCLIIIRLGQTDPHAEVMRTEPW